MVRAASLLALLAALIGWYEASRHVGAWSLWGAILLIAFVLMPACFLMIWLALPLWDTPWLRLAVATGVLVGLAFLCAALDFPVGENFCKLGALTLLGWLFLSFFEDLSWIVIVALLIPWVDAYSVWQGPTKVLASGKHENVFNSLSVAFVVPGGAAARLGLPDVLFFAVFLGASVRFHLRPNWTWVAMMVGLALTMILAHVWHVDGLPALPAISAGLLIANADLIWRRLRRA